jgi:hypothetical protein
MGAPINLKDCTITLRDGTSMTGAVNNGAGYPMATTTMTVDGFTDKVWPGYQFLVDVQTTVYTVTASTPGSGASTSITFTPGLTASVADDDVITVGPNELEVEIGEGQFSYTEKRNVDYYKDRGLLDTTREGDEEPVELTMDFKFSKIRAASGEWTPTVEEALKFIVGSPAEHWTPSDGNECSTPAALDVIILETPPCAGVPNQEWTFNDFRYEQLQHSFKDGTVSCSGKCNVTSATVERAVP